jgi:hypothetical protein
MATLARFLEVWFARNTACEISAEAAGGTSNLSVSDVR